MSAKLEWSTFISDDGPWTGRSGAIPICRVYKTFRKQSPWSWRLYIGAGGSSLAASLDAAKAAAESTFQAWLDSAGLMVKPPC